ncbi:MAG TPA: glycoside hydrolase family 16 protein [Tepidisphaeraceae bacterium]|jgi:beta-glucanase (GH16 family)|nr:glycoside hydrolase family 16 protein [Tepidisphaeraceae bacterium]
MRFCVIYGFLICAAITLAADGQTEAGKAVIDFADPAVLRQIAPSSAQVTVARAEGVDVTIAPGKESYPGIAIKPVGGKTWDLSAFGDVVAAVANTGKTPINLSLRVDNEGPWQDQPWSTESISLKPGESGRIKVIFGYSYGHKPAFALKSGAVTQMLLFAGKSGQEQSFRIKSIVAAGVAGEKPPVDPQSVRVEPEAGYLVGGKVVLDAEKQLAVTGGVKAENVAGSNALAIDVPAGTKGESSLAIKPKVGRWDLRFGSEVHIALKNTGAEPIAPAARIESNGGPTDTITLSAPLASGAQGELVIPFAPKVVWQGIPDSGNRTSWNGQPNTGTRFTSDTASSVVILLPGGQKDQSLIVESIRLEAPPAQIPDWLGKRPPVAGDWVKTFDDEFDGNAIDATKWNVVGKNWYDHQSRFVKENTIIGDGVARLHFEKRLGNWASEADGKQTPYATGFLDTFGKWTQRYGYFEARMKLPRAPGLWPAFWMMPDRGAASKTDRGSTANGGMEFDVMEHLTRWGPGRYNIAMHWDGYGKDHKQTGTSNIYVQPDAQGYITAGLLWTPGLAVYYCNGREVLRWKDPRIASVPCDLMFTLPMGGWDNNALDDKKLPDDFVIDYVRCWQRKDLVEKAAASGR